MKKELPLKNNIFIIDGPLIVYMLCVLKPFSVSNQIIFEVIELVSVCIESIPNETAFDSLVSHSQTLFPWFVVFVVPLLHLTSFL